MEKKQRGGLKKYMQEDRELTISIEWEIIISTQYSSRYPRELISTKNVAI